MNGWMSKGMLGALGMVGCVIWTGCGGGGAAAVRGVSNLGYVRAAENPGRIHLSWAPSPERSILGYSVRRRHAGEPAYSLVSNRLIEETSFTDQLPDPSDTRTLLYQVITVGENGRLSAPVEVAAVVSPPAPPAGF